MTMGFFSGCGAATSTSSSAERVRRAEAADVQDADETAVFDEDVGRDEVAVAHRVLVDLGQRPKLRPDPPQEGYVEQALAPPEACLEPLVVVREVPAATDAAV